MFERTQKNKKENNREKKNILPYISIIEKVKIIIKKLL